MLKLPIRHLPLLAPSTLVFIFFLSLLLLLLLQPNKVLAECRYVGDGSNCPSSSSCLSGEVLCTGTDTQTGAECSVCITQNAFGTCSDDDRDSNDNDFNWQYFAEEACKRGITQPCVSGSNLDVVCSVSGTEDSNVTLQNSCLGQRAIAANVITMGECGSSSLECSGVLSGPFYRGAKFCARPVCSPGQYYDGGTNPTCPYRPITCSITSATPISSTTVTAASKKDSGDINGYDQVEWTTTNLSTGSTQPFYSSINSDVNSTSTGSLTDLSLNNTQYNITAKYYSSANTRPAVQCDNSYTVGGSGAVGQTTCSLTASPQSLNTGGSSTWTLTSTGEPEGARGYWHGNTASVEGRVTAPDYVDTVLYSNSGSDSRYVEVKNSSGATLCTTDTVQVYVNPNYCSALSIAPSSLNLTVEGQGTLTAQGINGSISSWSSDNTSIASVTGFGNPTEISTSGTACPEEE